MEGFKSGKLGKFLRICTCGQLLYTSNASFGGYQDTYKGLYELRSCPSCKTSICVEIDEDMPLIIAI